MIKRTRLMENAYFYINWDNFVVLKTYLKTIEQALIGLGYKCEYVKSLDGVNKRALIVFVTGIDAFKYYFKGFKNYILWLQGVSADESFMKHGNKLKYWTLNMIDIFSMKKAKSLFFVSKYMLQHYEKLGHCSFSQKSYIMPCYNETLDSEIFNRKDYSKKIFCYVGSLAVWQCFKEAANLYKLIEEKIPDTKFKVLTFNVAEGTKILSDLGIKNYEIKQVPKELVKLELEDVSYGFIIRDDNIVNRVATPTKISSYMSAGVIPIFSSCLSDFNNEIASRNMKYALSLPQIIDIMEIVAFIEQDIDKREIREEYKNIFSSYFSMEYHYKNIYRLLRKLLS